jgi:hypothetical protein
MNLSDPVTVAAFLVVAFFAIFLAFREPKTQRRHNNHIVGRL